VKEDDVDRDKRRESAEKLKSVNDLEKKKEKKKNLARQALETRRAKSRQRGEPEEESPDEDDGGEGDDDSDDSEGPVSTGSSRVRLRLASTSRGRESLRGHQASLVRVNRESHLHAALAPTPPSACTRSDRPPPPTSPCI